jgi:CheY-like chemotaxis protein
LPEDVRVFNASGVNEVLLKPLSKEKLLAAFQVHLKTGDNAV